MNSEQQVLALYDYLDTLAAARAYVPPPPGLALLQFSPFDWEAPPAEKARTPRPGAAAGGGFLVLTHADTDLLALSRAVAGAGDELPAVRGYNVAHLTDQGDARAFVDAVLGDAEVVILRLLGGTQSFRGGLQRLAERAQTEDRWLLCLPGSEALDPELTGTSNTGAPLALEALAYFQLGGVSNLGNLLRFLSDHLLTTALGYDPPRPQPRHGVYRATTPRRESAPTAGILFYRSHLLSGNTAFVDALVDEVESRGANALAVFTTSLMDREEDDTALQQGDPPRPLVEGVLSRAVASDERLADGLPARLPAALRLMTEGGRPAVDVIITTTSFAANAGDGSRFNTIGSGGLATGPGRTFNENSRPSSIRPYQGGGEESPSVHNGHDDTDTAIPSMDPFALLGVPVIQAIAATTAREPWAMSARGLGPIDVAMSVAIPELDGRIVGVPVSFKSTAPLLAPTGDGRARVSPTALYAPDLERAARLADQALALAALRQGEKSERRVAIILTDYNGKASRAGGAVGLDTPTSLLRILEALGRAGYEVGELPSSGDALMHRLVSWLPYDRELPRTQGREGALVSAAAYTAGFERLPPGVRAPIVERWGDPPGRYGLGSDGSIALGGAAFGNVYVAIQPPRGYNMDPAAIYHAPELPPPHPYVALYGWLTRPTAHGGWGAEALVHLGKHGTLEWLPGKSVGLSQDCYPDALLPRVPLIYPFIVNNPGEGAQAKRRTHAVLVGHLTPPMTTADGYGEIEELTRLVDEYYQLEALDPSKLPLLQRQIWELIQRARLDQDLSQLLNRDASATHSHDWDPSVHPDGVPYSLSDMGARDFAHLVENINGYLCELTSAQIRDGLHVFGRQPEGQQLIDTLLALVRLPNLDVPSLRGGLAGALGLDLGELLEEPGRPLARPPAALEEAARQSCPTRAHALRAIDAVGLRLLEGLARADFEPSAVDEVVHEVLGEGVADVQIASALHFVCAELVPRLDRTHQEMDNLLHALTGGRVPPGPSGAPTRGMAHVLPTGRNFYTVDPRGLPSAAAWAVGQRLADELVSRYLADEGAYPEWVGISIWGTSLMRTHGDDVAQVMALLGVRPVWQAESRRLAGFEIIPLADLGRPRVDVVCRISGFFRDAFPDLVALLDRAVCAVADLDEPLERNAVRRHAQADRRNLEAAGVEEQAARRRATYRVFGSPPGAYGAGILPLMDEGNWHSDADLAQVYVNWGGYAYGSDAYGIDARSEFRTALGSVQAAVKNQDNREHDIFDSDDYFQYHGGMIASIRGLSGRAPRRYFGDSSDPHRARVRDLKEETLRVFRTRVVNPKWMASMRRHGYKGALELAATVDYLFGYDATAGVMEDWMYQRVAEAYALDPSMQRFFRESNPWALRDAAARLIEAMDRGLWKQPSPQVREALQAAYLRADADVEARASTMPSLIGSGDEQV
jgi:cobaltochelatase CobN